MKHIKFFESFVNEELTPELKKRTYDAMMKIADDPNAIDRLTRGQQAKNVQDYLSPEVEKLIQELKERAEKVVSSWIKVPTIYVGIIDRGLDAEIFLLYVEVGQYRGLEILISKDKYEKKRPQSTDAEYKLYSDRAFVNTLKKLIVQVQKDEIPGDEPVPAQPESLTPQGSLDNVPKEDVISRYGTGGDGMPDPRSEAGQIARQQMERHSYRRK